MEPGVYESLLTARLHQLLASSVDQVSDFADVDEIAAATGTGKTVVAALDYRRLRWIGVVDARRD